MGGVSERQGGQEGQGQEGKHREEAYSSERVWRGKKERGNSKHSPYEGLRGYQAKRWRGSSEKREAGQITTFGVDRRSQ